MWFTLVLGLAEEILKLINIKEKRKYQDKLLQLSKDYYAEQNKTPDIRSDAVMDNLEFELRITIIAIRSEPRE